MEQKIIAFDFDLTFVDSLTPWVNWANNSWANPKITMAEIKGVGDLVPFMESRGVQRPFEYWLMPDLYDNMEPMPLAVEVLRELKEDANCIVICVSKCAPEHIASKKRFLDKFVPFIDGFIDTALKEFVQFDILIDDSEEQVMACADRNRKVIQPYTPPSERVNKDGIIYLNAPYGDFWKYVSAKGIIELI